MVAALRQFTELQSLVLLDAHDIFLDTQIFHFGWTIS